MCLFVAAQANEQAVPGIILQELSRLLPSP